jgi:hypothetical protein
MFVVPIKLLKMVKSSISEMVILENIFNTIIFQKNVQLKTFFRHLIHTENRQRVTPTTSGGESES